VVHEWKMGAQEDKYYNYEGVGKNCQTSNRYPLCKVGFIGRIFIFYVYRRKKFGFIAQN